MEYIFFSVASQIKGVNIPKSEVGFKKMGRICSSAENLFAKKGFYDTSIADICRNAKTAIGTYYIYFQDKTAIYNYLVRNYYVVINNYLSKHIENCKTRYEMEREGIKAFIKFGHANPQCYKIIWGSSHIDPALFEDYYTRFAKNYVSALKKFSKEIVKIDYSTMAWFLMGISTFIALKVVLNHKRLTAKELNTLVDEVMVLLSQGMFINKE
jgi:AcrR family transcriptional regulator